jgi:hypothetical protein
VLELLNKDAVEERFGEAAASIISTDQVITWAKFVLTDDKPNENRQRVPIEEFDNIIKTGVFKPIKMALGEIKDGHEDSRPLGVITNLVKEGNKIVALAALWNHERSDDVSLVKDRIANGKPVNVSWEILYGNSEKNGLVSDLMDIVLKAVTIVGIPAYAGRTQLLAVAAKKEKKWSPAYIEGLPDTSFLLVENGTRYFAFRDESGKIDPSRFPAIMEEIADTSLPQNTLKSIRHQVKKLNSVISADASIIELLEEEEEFNAEDNTLETKDLEIKVTDLEAKLAVANDKLATKESELATAQEQFNLADTTLKTLQEEISPLREFKLEADKSAEKVTKLSAIKAKFEGANLTKPETYFEENAEKLLSMDENGLDFMLQEMTAFKEQEGKGEGEASKKKTPEVPNIPGQGGSTDILKLLRERDAERSKK